MMIELATVHYIPRTREMGMIAISQSWQRKLSNDHSYRRNHLQEWERVRFLNRTVHKLRGQQNYCSLDQEQASFELNSKLNLLVTCEFVQLLG